MCSFYSQKTNISDLSHLLQLSSINPLEKFKSNSNTAKQKLQNNVNVMLAIHTHTHTRDQVMMPATG